MPETQDPVVLIHGMFGWGARVTPLWNTAPSYWPTKAILESNPNSLIVEIGVGSSDYDRAVETFYQLFGGRVDYGEEHAKETQHERYGVTYDNPLFPDWSAEHPVHLVGHSYGATTAIELYQLLCDDHFGIGTNHKWVRSITSICGPLTGSTFGVIAGLDSMHSHIKRGSFGHILGSGCAIIYKLQLYFPWLNGLYDFRMKQWRHHMSWRRILSPHHQLNLSRDNVNHCLDVSYRAKRNAELKNMEKLYLFSIVCEEGPWFSWKKAIGIVTLSLLSYFGNRSSYFYSNKYVQLLFSKSNKRFRVASFLIAIGYLFKRTSCFDLAKSPILRGIGWLMNVHSRRIPKLYQDYDHELWQGNDGVVNTYSMMYPRKSKQWKTASCESLLEKDAMVRNASHLSVDLLCASDYYLQDEAYEDTAAADFERAIWHTYRVEKNHFCGTAADMTAAELYDRIFTALRRIELRDEQDQSTRPPYAPADRNLTSCA